MALKKRFREAARNEFRFFFFLFLVVLMIVTTVATSLYLYFSSFVPSLAPDCKKGQKLVHAIQKQICLLDEIICVKSPDHLFDLNFFYSMFHTITFQASVLGFFI